MADRPPYEIARETLKQLATRRLAPTPDNYLAIYDEIAGSRSFQPFPDAQLSSIQRVLPAQTPGQKRLLTQFERAIATKDWSALQSVLVGYANLGLSPVAATPVVSEPAAVHILPADFAEALARLIDNTLPALGEDDARVHDMATQLITFLREPDPPLSTVQLMLSNFTYRLSFATEDQAAIRASLLQLLHMIFENIAVLSVDDRWLRGQAESLMAASTPPLTLRRLDDVQLRLKDVIFKQTEAKARASRSANNPTKINMVPSPGQMHSQTVSPGLIKAGPGATTSLVTQAVPQPPLHQHTGLPKIAATRAFVDPQTMLPRKGSQSAAMTPLPPPAPRPAHSR